MNSKELEQDQLFQMIVNDLNKYAPLTGDTARHLTQLKETINGKDKYNFNNLQPLYKWLETMMSKDAIFKLDKLHRLVMSDWEFDNNSPFIKIDEQLFYWLMKDGKKESIKRYAFCVNYIVLSEDN